VSTERPTDERAADVAIDRAWRAASRDEPSASVDEAIVAAARAAVRSAARSPAAPGGRRWWTDWQPLAAAAGVVGLAFVLVQQIPRDDGQRTAPEIETARQESTATPAAAPAAAPAAPPAPTPSRQATSEAFEAPAASPGRGPEVSVRTQAAPRKADVASDAAPPPAPAVLSTEAAASAGAAMRGAAESSVAPQTGDAARPTPEGWAQRIVELHAAGDVEAAAAELRSFRAAYRDADRHLPVALRPWAATVAASGEL
jgi:hypothetical protein